MGPTMKDLGIDKLPADQRTALAQEILDSLDDARADHDLSEEQWAEIDRRGAEMDANPGMAITWAEIRSRVEAGK